MDLDDLIEQVEGDDPLDRLANAMAVKAELDELADSLIGHFVDAARRDGCSWSEIGAAMGVTKQAAQQRHTSERPSRRGRGFGPLFTRFTPRARYAVREAEDAARELRHDYLGTEHVLLGLLAVSQGIAGKSLAGLGVTRDAVVAKLVPGEGGRERGRRKHVPFTPKAKQVIEGALAEALTLGHNYVGTEHLLLALYRVPDGLAATILGGLGITHERVRADIIDRLTKYAAS
ncbi:MAG TPA: Clp protease N-terminal domain-containing protein [Acidimicrobiales bacterium]|nr:Clp protease N-terminal domain-containing protein [Acidimicrobiales bacterium]